MTNQPKELSDIAEPNAQNVRVGDLVVDVVGTNGRCGGKIPLTFNRVKAVSNSGVILDKCFEKSSYGGVLDRYCTRERYEKEVDDIFDYGMYELPFSECLILRPDGTYLLGEEFANYRNKNLDK